MVRWIELRLSERTLKAALSAAVLIVIVFSTSALADKYDTNISNNARALAMGNAGINTERGPSSIFYNPANIAYKTTDSVLQFTNITLETNEGMVTQASSGSFNFTDFSKMQKEALAHPGNFSGSRVSLYPNITFRNFTVGALYELNRGMMIRNTDRALYVKARDRFAPTAAFSFRMAGGIFRFGAMAQYLTVGEADKFIQNPLTTTPKPDYGNTIGAKAGIAKNAGITITLPIRFLPSFSFVARDIGSTTFTKPALLLSGSGTAPQTRKATYDIGASFTWYWGSRIDTKWEIDYRDATHPTTDGRLRHVFAGTEITMFDFLHLRGGYMHGWPTAGLGIGTSKASLNISWYSDELENRLRAARDQRFVLQYVHSLFGGK